MKPLAPIFEKLRGQIIALTPEQLKLVPSDDLVHVWAAFMEMSVSDSVASLLASAGVLRASTSGPAVGSSARASTRR